MVALGNTFVLLFFLFKQSVTVKNLDACQLYEVMWLKSEIAFQNGSVSQEITCVL